MPLQRLADDSDWGEDYDSGFIHETDHYPNFDSNPEYEVEFLDIDPLDTMMGPGTIPFIVDRGASKIFLAPEGCFHAQIIAAMPNTIGPIERGYIWNNEVRFDGEISNRTFDAVQKALAPYTGNRLGKVIDDQTCPECEEPLANCRCFSWGEGAEWATGPIDQSTIREMKPAIQASLTPQQKAAAWDKPQSELSPEELRYVSKNA